MRIGIITHYYKSQNYGGNLQAYALCKVLKNLGHEAEQICFDKNKGTSFLKSVKIKLAKIKNLKIFTNCANFKKRKKAFLEFNQGIIPHSKIVYDSKSIRDCSKDYDAFITGSDQVWHPLAVCDAYLLNFVDAEKKKISYAASIATTELDEKTKAKYRWSLSDFSAISVREETAIDLLRDVTEHNIECTLDPTLLLTKEEWDSISTPSCINEDYLFCYFLGEDQKQRELANEYAKKNNLKIVTLPNLLGENRKCDKNFGDYRLYDVNPTRLISLIKDAKCIFTDSFHATVFSSIYEKEHFVFERTGHKGMGSRIVSLTNMFGTQKRYCNTDERKSIEYITSIDSFYIDYEKYDYLKQKSMEFLNRHLATVPSKAITIKEKYKCSGCHSCANVCPKNCIEMVADKEGFLYPKVNETLCINCGKCVKSCPILTPKKASNLDNDILAYGAYNKDDNVRLKSSSGGIFTALAETVIKEGGVVFGAAFDNNFNVIHTSANNIEELEKFRGSKYVQSKIGNTYAEAKELLDNGITVYFSGTPCQISGLYSFLDKDYDNLITQDIICHGVPSPLVWQKYLEFQTTRTKETVEDAQFRNKKFGWENFSMLLKFKNGSEYISSLNKDFYMQAFLRNYCLRPSCHKCFFKQKVRQSDITLADFWGVEFVLPQFYDERGVSLVVVNSKKGQSIFKKVENVVSYTKTNYIDALKYNSAATKSALMPQRRSEFMKEISVNGFAKIREKFFKASLFSKVKKRLKRLFKGRK